MATGWSKDKRPARQKYWDRRTLENRKVRHILANKQKIVMHSMKGEDNHKVLMTVSDARRWWQFHRKGRVPDKYLPLTKVPV
jgi:hypothetical protein